MSYDDEKTILGISDCDLLLTILQKQLQSVINIRTNLQETQTIIIKREKIERIVVLDKKSRPVVKNGKPVLEDKVTPAITKVPVNNRTFAEFTDEDRISQQSSALTQLKKLKSKINK